MNTRAASLDVIDTALDDDDVFVKLATTYATNHKTMFLGKSCENDLIGRAENEQQALKVKFYIKK